MRFALPLVLIAALLAGCAHRPAAPISGAVVEVEPPRETSLAWRDIAHADHAVRIASLANRYAAVLGDKGAEGLRVDARKGWPEPTPGVYDCRITRLGVGQTVVKAMAFRSFFCYVGDDRDFLTLTKSAGTERPGGRLWRDGDQRMVFLGGVPASGKTQPNAYGDDAATDRIGVFERIGEFRWRLILDAPQPGVAFDVLELTPRPLSLATAR